MTYAKITDFASKDYLLTGNPNKIIRGTEIDDELVAIENEFNNGVIAKTGSTGSAKIPAGTQGQRDASPATGYARFNTTTGAFEGYNGTEWGPLGSNNGPVVDIETYTATASQTVFTLVNGYEVGKRQVEVFVNGLLMTVTTDYVETDYQTITFNSGLTVGDEVTFRIWRSDTLVDGDAANMSYSPAGGAAVTTTVQAKLRESVSVKDFGAVGDGVADDTAAIQAALDAASGTAPLYVNPGVYKCKNLLVRSNTTIIFDTEAVLEAPAGAALTDAMLIFQLVSKVTIHGNHAQVRMLKSEYVSGEQRHGVLILASTDIAIHDLHSDDTGGDGFYVGANYDTTPSQRVSLINCYANNNRRQGLSIVCVKDCWVIGGKYSNTTGTAPSAGIDVEPNSSCVIQNVNILNVTTSGNDGAGILVVPLGSGVSADSVFTVNISGCTSVGDGVVRDGSFRFDNGALPANQIYGNITVSDCKSIDSGRQGLNIGSTAWSLCPDLVISNLKVLNPAGVATPSTAGACGVTLATGSGVVGVTNVKLSAISCEDNRSTKKMFFPYYVSGSAAVTSNINMVDCYGSGYLGSGGPVAFVGGVSDFNVSFTKPNTATFSANADIDRYPGMLITQSSSAVFTLPLASARLGVVYEFLNTQATTLQIKTVSPDVIYQNVTVTTENLILRQIGSYVKIMAVSGGWVVLASTGQSAPTGFVDGGRTVYSTAAPTTRTWAVKDRCVNSAPTVGQPKAWVCTVAGTPGTWVSEGNL